jgi:hypothetical protein
MENEMIARGGGMSKLERMMGLRGRDFRNTRWGLSSKKVKQLEAAAPFFESDDLLVYKTSLAYKPVEVVYLFAGDQLVRTKYMFTEVPQNGYYEDYVSIVETLTMKYGAPVYEDQIWHDDLFRNNRNFIGEALINSHVSFYSQWCVGNTFITHGLSNNGDGITHEIEYKSMAYQGREQTCILRDL